MMKATFGGLALAASLIATLAWAAPVAAHAPSKTVYRSGSTAECKVAVHLGRLKAGAPCRTRLTIGAVTFRRLTAASYGPTACEPMTDHGCYGPPNPSRWFDVDSYTYTAGPAGLWQVWMYYHFKTNGYEIVPTERPSCETFHVGVTITMSECAIYALSDGRHRISARWKECFVHPIFGFCHTKGTQMTIDPRGHYSYKSW